MQGIVRSAEQNEYNYKTRDLYQVEYTEYIFPDLGF